MVSDRCAEPRSDLRGRDAVADQRRIAGLPAQRHLAADLPHAAGELTDTPLARVVTDDPPVGPLREPKWRSRQAGGPILGAYQMRFGDGDLLVLGVAEQADDLEAVAQGRRDPGRFVRRRDEQHA